MKRSNNSKNWLIYLIALGFAVLIATGYFLNQNEEKDLKGFGIQTQGKVIGIDHRRNRGEFIEYEYFVNNQRYTDQQAKEGSLQVGDMVKVIYSSKDPEISKILFNNEIVE